jgi:hypothetical protein
MGQKHPAAICGPRDNRISGLPQPSVTRVSAWADTRRRGFDDCLTSGGVREVEEIVKSRANQGIEKFVLIEFPTLRIMLAALLTAAVGMMTTVAAAGEALVRHEEGARRHGVTSARSSPCVGHRDTSSVTRRFC